LAAAAEAFYSGISQAAGPLRNVNLGGG